MNPVHPEPWRSLPGSWWLLSACILLCTACGNGATDDPISAIKGLMAMQESAWDRGDIESFMAIYEEGVCFTSSKGTTCGREAVTANYRRSYPDQAAMGDLSFAIGEVLPVGGQHAWCTGTWQLSRAQDTLSGGFSLLWQRVPEGWRIIRDHTY